MEIRVKFEKSGEKKVVGVKDVRDVNASDNGRMSVFCYCFAVGLLVCQFFLHHLHHLTKQLCCNHL